MGMACASDTKNKDNINNYINNHNSLTKESEVKIQFPSKNYTKKTDNLGNEISVSNKKNCSPIDIKLDKNKTKQIDKESQIMLFNKIFGNENSESKKEISKNNISYEEEELKQFSKENISLKTKSPHSFINKELLFKGESIKFEDGSYRGGLNQDKLPDGNGILIYKNGNIYMGEFRNGVKDGQGRYEFKSGVYVGEFKLNKMHGKGKLIYKNKDTYEGKINTQKWILL